MILTEFLLARIAADEVWARQATPSPAIRETQARVLAECEAKRMRLALADDLEGEADDDTYKWASSVADRIRRIEALPHADHPDYDEAWRP